MKAIVIKAYGGPEQLVMKEIPDPQPRAGEVLIRVRAFGVNRAETYMRRGVWGDVARVSGIECVGEIVEDSTGQSRPGQVVAAIMGGMGRSINGSYAEYVTLPARNVFHLETGLDWAELAAIPESYATAWSCLHDNLSLQEGNVLLVRGGTSALGQAALNIAANISNVTVLATTRKPGHLALLESLGCGSGLIEQPELSQEVRRRHPDGIDAVMDIIGNTTLKDSLKMVKKGGSVCNAGFLGGGDPMLFNPLTDMPSCVNLNFFGSFMLGSKDFPLTDIPMQTIVDRVEQGIYHARPAHIFPFHAVGKAHELMEAGQATGKIVIKGV
ncbi:MAG TPA: alcohol dehydrogenase [Gammaproteobacteria bacterium]|nr:alcohol dehydrogenase [Gammaproteobacteria bacterium]